MLGHCGASVQPTIDDSTIDIEAVLIAAESTSERDTMSPSVALFHT